MENVSQVSPQDDSKFFEFNKELFPGSVKTAMSGEKSRDLWQVHPSKIRIIDGFNPRIKDDEFWAHVREIADSIKSEGYYFDKPVSAYISRENGVDVICLTEGECRLRASLLAIEEGAELQVIPVVVKDRSVSIEDLTVALLRSNSGKAFSPYEVSIIAKRLVGFGWDEEKIAQRLGITTTYVNDLLLVAGSPRRIRDLVQTKVISLGTAVDAMRKHGEHAVEVLEAALNKAQSSGKEKVSAKHMPGYARTKFIKKQAAPLANLVIELKKTGFIDRMPDEIKAKFEEFLQGLEQSEKEETEKDDRNEQGGSDE